MRFLEEMLKFFPDAQIRCLCADREFIGQAWLRYLLLEPSLPFRIRIRATDKIKRGGKTLAAKVVFAHLARGESQQLQGDCRVWGYQVSVEALRLDDGDFLVVIAPPIRSVSFATTLYAGGLKLFLGFSRLVGFVWNPPTLLTPSACGLLFALLTLALVWSLKTGLWLHQLHPIPLKKRKRSGGLKKKKDKPFPSSHKIRQLSTSHLHQNK
jgi:hypothetical protein